jgi:hypothetical protein
MRFAGAVLLSLVGAVLLLVGAILLAFVGASLLSLVRASRPRSFVGALIEAACGVSMQPALTNINVLTNNAPGTDKGKAARTNER